MQRLLLTSLEVFPRLSIHHVGRLLNWILIAVVIVIAMIGFLYITRGTAVRRVRAVGADGSPVSPDEETFPLTVALLTGAVLMPGNEVELVLDVFGKPRRIRTTDYEVPSLSVIPTSQGNEVEFPQFGDVGGQAVDRLLPPSRAARGLADSHG